MIKKIKNLFSILIIFLLIILKNNLILAGHIENYIEPEKRSNLDYGQSKRKSSETQIIVTANDYASEIGEKILDKGGNVADATVAIQLTLGLVEPQSSGIGGGTFITYYDNTKKKVFFYDGREKAPQNINQNIFLKNDGSKKKFFDAAIGGQSVGVPGTNPISSTVVCGTSNDAGTPAATANFASAITSCGSRPGAKSKVTPVYTGSFAPLECCITTSTGLLGAKSNVISLGPANCSTTFSTFFISVVFVSISRKVFCASSVLILQLVN